MVKNKIKLGTTTVNSIVIHLKFLEKTHLLTLLVLHQLFITTKKLMTVIRQITIVNLKDLTLNSIDRTSYHAWTKAISLKIRTV